MAISLSVGAGGATIWVRTSGSWRAPDSPSLWSVANACFLECLLYLFYFLSLSVLLFSPWHSIILRIMQIMRPISMFISHQECISEKERSVEVKIDMSRCEPITSRAKCRIGCISKIAGWLLSLLLFSSSFCSCCSCYSFSSSSVSIK